jgi:ribosomal protein S27E
MDSNAFFAWSIKEKEGKEMKITCVRCAHEINLDHKVFENYAGPIKCFRCGTMMDVRTEGGTLSSLGLSPSERARSEKKVFEQRA